MKKEAACKEETQVLNKFLSELNFECEKKKITLNNNLKEKSKKLITYLRKSKLAG